MSNQKEKSKMSDFEQLSLVNFMSDEEKQDHYFQNFLNELINRSFSLSDQGALFEGTCKQILETANFFKDYVRKVWHWKDFPGNKNLHDIGIDLVVLDNNENFWAVQCKFYDQSRSVSKGDIDSFLSAGSMTFVYDGNQCEFSTLYIMSTTRKISSNAEAVMKDHKPTVILFGPEDFKNCGIQWRTFKRDNPKALVSTEKKSLFTHQLEARDKVLDGFKTNDRGRLIMACGTGKTFTSLKILEQYVLDNKIKNPRFLYLVSSIALLAQTVLEWKSQFQLEQGNNMFAICSDPTAAERKRAQEVDETVVDLTNIPIPATTNVDYLLEHYQRYQNDGKVHFFFSTYQSIDVIQELQKQTGIVFDIIICDEAHRTFGAQKEGDSQSDFIKVHSNDFIQGKKRLYMTATEKVYSPGAKKQAGDLGYTVLFSMDDIDVFGPRFYYLSFGEAVSKNLLSDYRLIVLQIKESQVLSLMNLTSSLDLDTTARLMGSIAALSKKTIDFDNQDFEDDPLPMKRAVVFTSTIKAAQDIASAYNELSNPILLGTDYLTERNLVIPKADFITGFDNSSIKKGKLDILRDPNISDNECRILTNARCLSEGVDVPTLDAVVFLARKRAQIDIVQAVGRVMRKPKGSTKKRGYIILPVVIKDERLTDSVLSSNEDFKVVWQVLQALRSHDERLENEINKFEHTHKLPSCVILANTFFPPRKPRSGVVNPRPISEGNEYETYVEEELLLFPEDLKKNEELFGAATVKRVGNRLYWEDWSKEIGDVTNAVALKIAHIVRGDYANSQAAIEFSRFKKGLNDILNPDISDDDAIAMLAEHMVTLPVFTAIFDNEDFVSRNNVTRIMSNMLDKLSDAGLSSETEKLQTYYESVKETVRGITDSAQKQSLVKKIYETFFQYALPKAQEKFGIVYTPNEIVDFMINSIEHVLKSEFGETLSNPGIKILDPFTGTGTFIVRLLDLLIEKGIDIEKLEEKYNNDIWCNEIMLLAYYVALINIEATFGAYKGSFHPFEHAIFTDTFQMAERKLKGNYQPSSYSAEYRDFVPAFEKQKEEDDSEIRVIIANPPYSVGQKNASDNNQNSKYSKLDNRIRETYLSGLSKVNVRSVYDSYVRSFRWASDRITENGIIAYVTNGSFIDNLAFSGFRRSLLEEFQSVYVFNLRGNARTQGELRRKEKDNVFGQGTRTTICITILIKHHSRPFDGYVHYHDIGDYLEQDKKLSILRTSKDISNIKWQKIVPDSSNDWLNKKSDRFSEFLLIGDKKNGESAIFSEKYSTGIKTGKDIWQYNFSPVSAQKNNETYIKTYNSEVDRLADKMLTEEQFRAQVTKDLTKIKWSNAILIKGVRGLRIDDNHDYRQFLYRPFVKVYGAYNPPLFYDLVRWPNILPTADSSNLVISFSSPPSKQEFSTMICNTVVDLHVFEQAQVFPLYWYEEKKQNGQLNLFSEDDKHEKTTKKYTVSDESLQLFRDIYEDKSISKEDIFFYIYGVFHSPTYKTNYKTNLAKVFPRIPYLFNFKKYSEVGRNLAAIHLNYENEEPYKDLKITITKDNYSVEKLRFADKNNKVSIVYNEWIKIDNIPIEAHDYKINGRSPLEWVVDQYKRTIDKDSGIVNDPNMFSEKGGKYVFDLILSLITVSLKTIELVNSLPKYEEIE